MAVTAALAFAAPAASAGESGGVVLSGSGCRYARVTVPRRLPRNPAHTITTRGTYATWILYRGKPSPANQTYYAATSWPAVSAKSLPLAPGTTLDAGTYTLVLCSDGATTLRLSLPGAKRWTTAAAKVTGPREATVAEIGVAAEPGVARGPLSQSTATFSFLIAYRIAGTGANYLRVCFTDPGRLCSTSTGEVFDFVEVDPDRAAYLLYRMFDAGRPMDGVAEMVGTRPYLGTDRDRLLVASIPTP